MNTKIFKWAVLLTLVFTLAFSTVALAGETVPLNNAHIGATNPGFSTGECPNPPAGQEGWYGWHFIMPGNNNFTSLTVTFANAGTYSASPFPGDVFVASPDNSHAYIWTPGPDTLLSGSATSDGDNKFFNLSHVCPGTPQEKLEVSKTVETTYEREHFWDIEKSVTPSDLYLYIPGQGAGKPSSGTAAWEVKVTYGGFVDYGFNISGVIKVKNTGLIGAVVTSVTDILAGDEIDITCPVSFPYTLPAGESFTCAYSEDFTDFVEGNNVVLVETEKATYTDTKAINWGAPDKEINKTVTIEDSMFGSLGTVTAPNDKTFSYTETYNWEDFGADKCGDHKVDNTATIVETGQSASASLLVHVQCYKYETAYGKGNSATCFIPTFSNWGWTNYLPAFGSYTFELWAAAGQCNTSKGTLVGSVTVNYSGLVSYSYNVAAPYMLKETHFYAGKTMFPKVGSKFTVAPGQYTNKGPFTGPIYVIAHAVVGLPDPTFGPK
jgi:hypothetical protein